MSSAELGQTTHIKIGNLKGKNTVSENFGLDEIITRRTFLKRATLAAGVFAGLGTVLSAQGLVMNQETQTENHNDLESLGAGNLDTPTFTDDDYHRKKDKLDQRKNEISSGKGIFVLSLVLSYIPLSIVEKLKAMQAKKISHTNHASS